MYPTQQPFTPILPCSPQDLAVNLPLLSQETIMAASQEDWRTQRALALVLDLLAKTFICMNIVVCLLLSQCQGEMLSQRVFYSLPRFHPFVSFGSQIYTSYLFRYFV